MASFSADPDPLASGVPLMKGNSRVKHARKLARRAFRTDERLFLAEGPNAVEAALGRSGGVVEVFADAAAGTTYAALRELAGERWTTVDAAALASMCDTVHPQGVVAVCNFLDVPVGTALAGEPRLVAICADVRDPGNAGAVIRCADAVGADAVVLAGHSVDAYNPKTVRATVGSLFHLPVVVEADPAEAVRAAQRAGLRVLAADGAGELDLFGAEELLAEPTAWLFGNEAWGLPAELAGLADHRVRIPILGRAESLNLSTAAAVCLYASARAQR